MSVAIDIAVEAPAWRAMPDAERMLRRAIEAALADTGMGSTEVGVVLTDDHRMRLLNREWRGIDKATNVLSFRGPGRVPGGPAFLGDLVFSFDTIEREARSAGIAIQQHLAHLAVHGALHLLGFDHDDDRAAETMEDRERAILARLGVPDPYADDRRWTGPA